MEEEVSNPLISTSPATDTSPEIQLHPLVLLTISDYITRHTLRKQDGPIVGAIMGQQNGREITMEVAFEAKLVTTDAAYKIDDAWFTERVEQFKEVYKVPQLELVGWFTVGSPAGPASFHVPIHHQLQQQGYESACLLLFHPNAITSGGKLPLSIYEGVVTAENAMDMDGAEKPSSLKFRKLNYAVETGEAEMISVDFVAKGSGNATAIDTKSDNKPSETSTADKAKGKSKDTEGGDNAVTNGVEKSYLSPEDDELISSLTAKSNAIKMLRSRINLIRSYLASLPPSYLTDASLPPSSDVDLNHPILRSVLALQARIPLLVPPDTAAFAREGLEQKSDTALVQLLSSATSSVHETGEMMRKAGIVENTRNSRQARGGRGMGIDGSQDFFHGAGMMGEDIAPGLLSRDA